MESETIVTPEPTSEPQVETQPVPPDPPDMQAVHAYFTQLQVELAARITQIELFLGFVQGTEALGTRVAKLEAFLGVK